MSTRAKATLAAAGLALLALTLAACSSGTPSPSVARLPSGADTVVSSGGDVLQLAGQCLRQHGLPNFPDPAVATDGPAAGHAILDKSALKGYPDSAVNQALDACRVAMDEAGLLTGQGSSVSSQEIQARLALARCIRAHGVPNFPDPNPTTGEVTPPPGLSKTSPSILAAIKACPSQAQAAGLSPGDS